MGRIGDAWGALLGRPKIVEVPAEADFEAEAKSHVLNDIVSIGLASGGGRRGTRGMLHVHSDVPGVRSIVERVTGSVAAVPWGAYRAKRGRSARSVPKLLRMKARLGEPRDLVLRQMLNADELEPLPLHPALALLDRPNRALTSQQTIATLQAHVEYAGNAFLLLERLGRTGRPFEMWPIPPSWVQPQGLARSPSPTHYSIHGGPFQHANVPPEDVIWIKNPDPADPYDFGSGLASSLNHEIDADEQAALTLSAFLRNRGIPAGIASFTGADEKSLAALQEKWQQSYAGPRNSGRVAFTRFPVDYKQITQKLVDMDMVGIRRFLREVLSEHFGVPPEILGRLENSNRATITMAQTIYAIYVLVPRLDALQDALNRWLVPLFGDEDVCLLYENPIPDDWDFRLDAAKAAPWSKSLNEWRALTGDQPLEGPAGEAHLVPFTVQAVLPKDLLESTARPEPEPEPEGDDPPDDGEDEDEDEEESGGKAARGLTKQDNDRIHRILGAVRPTTLVNRTLGVMRERLVAWFRQAMRALGMDPEVGAIRRLVDRHLANWTASRVANMINGTTQRALRAALQAGMAAGEGVKALETRIHKVFDRAQKSRAALIAETEVVRSSNWATHVAHQRAPHVRERVWITMGDHVVRHAHRVLHGQKRGTSDAFVIPSGSHAGATTMYPGGFGQAALDVGCRCLTIPSQGEQRSAQQMERLGKANDAEIIPWERALRAAFRRGFEDQRRDAIAELRRVFNERGDG